ncbi:MAG TPA: acetyl-CoA acetyltransferase [Rhodocyclaceae bacterium]|nr:acetyl-CoA acetyltransferase [Rhodocyclaceae bacterium]HRQ47225.1 acetyl-CoA acetyltransferase [Rhodocyclaceae bacterium]
MGACIVGWAHSPFGRLEDDDLESLIAGVVREALAHATVSASAVDGIWLGNLNGGLVPEIFCSSLVLQADDRLRWIPATRVENACASGAAAVFSALDAIEAGRAKVALVVGAEKMTAVSGAEVTRVLGNASYVREEAACGLTFPGIFAQMAQRYFEQYGDHSEILARIAVKNHANGVHNPWAHMRKDLGLDFCNTVSERNPVIAAPLRKTDCSLVSDGAAALLLADESLVRDFPRAVSFRGRAQVNDYLPMSRRDPIAFEGPRRAWRQALEEARCGVRDLSFAEVHDCFTVAELLAYEAMGLAPPGQGARMIEDGSVYRDGRLPINVSGGLKAKGHPIGATGVSMHVLSAMQLCSEAGDLQIPGASLGAVFNMGGSAVANYVSVLERIQ